MAKAKKSKSLSPDHKIAATSGGTARTPTSGQQDSSEWKTVLTSNLKKAPPKPAESPAPKPSDLLNPDSDKKPAAMTIRPKIPSPDRKKDTDAQGKPIVTTVTKPDTSGQQDDDESEDGLGDQWIPQAFDTSGFSASQSMIAFSQGTNQDGTSTTASPAERSRMDIIMGGFDSVDDDPRDMLLELLDEAIENIGASGPLFTEAQKMSVKNFWLLWNLDTWANLVEELATDVKKAKRFVWDTAQLTGRLNKEIEPEHQGHVMTAVITGYGPIFVARHVSKLKSGETSSPEIQDYRLFGDSGFLDIWRIAYTRETQGSGLESRVEVLVPRC